MQRCREGRTPGATPRLGGGCQGPPSPPEGFCEWGWLSDRYSSNGIASVSGSAVHLRNLRVHHRCPAVTLDRDRLRRRHLSLPKTADRFLLTITRTSATMPTLRNTEVI